ncbi:MAG: hypothetical protein ABSG86_07460 [Thermoguttaceae bacterium]|jgi:HEAT repeat protein
MNHRSRLSLPAAIVLAVSAAFAVGGSVRGQDEEVPGPKPAVKKAKPSGGKAKPGPKSEEGPAGPAKPSAKGPVEAPEDPAIVAILAVKPKTPVDCFRTARTLWRLGRPELARPLLRQILAGQPDDESLAGLVQEFGSPALAELSNQPALLPEAEQLAAAALGAVNRRLQDPKRIADLIGQLQDPSAEARRGAMLGLREGRGPAVAALLSALADPAQAAGRPALQAALVTMRTEAFEPLAAILDSADAELKIQALTVLGEMNLPGAAIWLVGPAFDPASDARVRAAAVAALKRLSGGVPSRAQATEWLYEQARNYFRGRLVLKVDADSRVQVSSWDAAGGKCVSRNTTIDDACRVMAARLARQAHAVAPDDPRVTVLWLAATLDEMVYSRGLEKPLDFDKEAGLRRIAKLGAPTLEAVLDYATAEGHPAAGRAAAVILGRIGSAQELLRKGQEPGPLVRAARSPDRRLRLAALEAIVRLEPDGPYPGSSWVPESLAFLAATQGARRALLAGTGPDTFVDLAAALATMHVAPAKASFGHEAIRMALQSPDYEVLLIDAGVGNPVVETVVQHLRQDYRTAGLAIGVVARSGFFERAERLARDDPRTLSIARPHSTETAQAELDALWAIRPQEFVAFPERQEQAARALACLATLASSSRRVYDLEPAEEAVSTALYVPGLGGRVAAVLANLPSRASQLALVDLASRHVQPLEVRKAAARAFRISTRKYGLLLPQEAIQRQYERYQASKDLDVTTQQVLGSLLDAIEDRQGTTLPRTEPGKTKEKPAEKRPGNKTGPAKIAN